MSGRAVHTIAGTLSSMKRALPGVRGIVEGSCRRASCSNLMTCMQQETCRGYPVAEILLGSAEPRAVLTAIRKSLHARQRCKRAAASAWTLLGLFAVFFLPTIQG